MSRQESGEGGRAIGRRDIDVVVRTVVSCRDQ